VRRGRWFDALTPLALMAALALLLGACSNADEPPENVFRLGIAEPVAIDPYNAQESEGHSITKALFEGLTKVAPGTSEVIAGMAERWDRNGSCTEWTFDLRRDTRFSNGEPVTAQSFVDGMTRAAVPEARSDTAQFLSDIDGYAEVHGTADAGPTATTFSGLVASQSHRLVVRLSRPNCEFDKKTVQPVFSPVPSVAGKADPASAFAQMPIGNGPFKMAEPWQHDRSITLVRNDLYYGPKPQLDEVQFTILPAQTAVELEYRNFRAGRADWARVPPAQLPEARREYESRRQFLAEPKFGATFLLVNVVNPPLQDVRARQAVSLAIDRDAIITSAFNGFQTKATSLVPPPLVPYHRPGACTTCERPDPDRARALAREGGIPPGTRLNLAFNTGAGNEAWVQILAAQLRDVLGLDVNLEGLPFRELLEKEKATDASGLFRQAWGIDYPSADAFLRPLLSESALPPGDNRGRYVNERFDALLDEAVAQTDENRKVALTQEAERLAIGEDQALIPLWYRTQYRVFSSRFSGVAMDFFENPTLADIRLNR
jgi:oligopeptide transport system substrate-binding protein